VAAFAKRVTRRWIAPGRSFAEEVDMRLSTSLVLVLALLPLTACMVGPDEDEEVLDPDVVIEEPSSDLPADFVDNLPPPDDRLVLASGGNKLGNAGFEAGIGSNATEGYENWVSIGTAKRESSGARTGAYGLRVVGTTSSEMAVATQMFRIDGNGTYRVSVDARLVTNGVMHQRVYFYFYDLFGRQTGEPRAGIVRTAEHKWHTETWTMKAPGDAWFMAIGVGKGWKCPERCGAGVTYFDNASVVAQ